MSEIETEILEMFFERLSESDEIGEALMSNLRSAFADKRLPKADQLTDLIATGVGEVSV